MTESGPFHVDRPGRRGPGGFVSVVPRETLPWVVGRVGIRDPSTSPRRGARWISGAPGGARYRRLRRLVGRDRATTGGRPCRHGQRRTGARTAMRRGKGDSVPSRDATESATTPRLGGRCRGGDVPPPVVAVSVCGDRSHDTAASCPRIARTRANGAEQYRPDCQPSKRSGHRLTPHSSASTIVACCRRSQGCLPCGWLQGARQVPLRSQECGGGAAVGRPGGAGDGTSRVSCPWASVPPILSGHSGSPAALTRAP